MYHVRIKIVLLMLCCVLLMQCRTEVPLTEKELHTQVITSGTWILDHLTIDELEQNMFFKGMTLQFTDTSFTSVNGFPIWPQSSAWSFMDEAAKRIVRDGNVQFQIIEITDTKLVLRQQWERATFTAASNSSIMGNYIFTFKK